MEKISTPRADLLPRAANLATLVVVASAMWWSGAQRPAGQPVIAVSDSLPAAQVASATAPRPLAVTATTGGATAVAATWPAQAATTIARDGLQPVGYQTRAR